MKIKRPRLQVTRPESAFAEGNARWTNIDLDPVPKHQRNWGSISFVGAYGYSPHLYNSSNTE